MKIRLNEEYKKFIISKIGNRINDLDFDLDAIHEAFYLGVDVEGDKGVEVLGCKYGGWNIRIKDIHYDIIED